MSMSKKLATIRDVARASGVSPATVSYVINDGPRRVDPATRSRILVEIDRLRYHPSSVARGLSRKRMNAVGVVFPQPHQRVLVDSYFNSILDGIVEAATNREQNVMLYTGLEWRGRGHMHGFLDTRVDGLILIAVRADSEMVEALADHGRAFVLINDTSADPSVASVDIDNAAAVQHVVHHLYELGHRRIGLLSGEESSPSTRARREGYLRGMREHGLGIDPSIVVEGYYSRGWGCEAMADVLKHPNPPTAVIAGGDGIAVGAMDACAQMGVEIPGKMSIVGFDDAPFARDAKPPLTTVLQPLQQIGITAATLLLDIVERDPEDSRSDANIKKVLPTELIVRQSTGPARATLGLA
jgi:DNA-binding LacI/PurR family transcriptional regulator